MMERRQFLNRTFKLLAAGMAIPPIVRAATPLGQIDDGWSAAALGLPSSHPGGADGQPILVSIHLGNGLLSGSSNGILAGGPLASELTAPRVAGHRLDPALAPLKPLFDDGKLAMVRGLICPGPRVSPSRTTEILFAGSRNSSTGWLARYFETTHPDFPRKLPAAPFMIQLGHRHHVPLKGARGYVGLMIADHASFAAESEAVPDGDENNADTSLLLAAAGRGLRHREVSSSRFAHATAIRSAMRHGTNTIDYPTTHLGRQLRLIARLIGGRLGTSSYLAATAPIDVNSDNTLGAEARTDPALAMVTFIGDLQNQGLLRNVIVVTTSDVMPTDQDRDDGAGPVMTMPQLVLGPDVIGGFHGERLPGAALAGEISDRSAMQLDFRRFYATILRNHFGASRALTAQVLDGDFAPMQFIDRRSIDRRAEAVA